MKAGSASAIDGLSERNEVNQAIRVATKCRNADGYIVVAALGWQEHSQAETQDGCKRTEEEAGQSQPNWMQNPPQAKPPPMATRQGVKLRGWP